ncbi:hypothetical protein UF75_5283 [Desulfosporosinus sp. I2]|nr:hypothetical protein UF75_5283 [Desulfosporosinus sp. I2]
MKPVYNLLKMEGIPTLVVNAQHIKLYLDVKPMLKTQNGLLI